jgi:hypothetical protein
MFKITLGKQIYTRIQQITKFKLNCFYDKADERNKKGNSNTNSNPNETTKPQKAKDYNKPQFYNYKPSKKQIERGLNYQKEDEQAFRLIQEKQNELENKQTNSVNTVADEKNFKSN